MQVRVHYLELQDWWEREAEFVRETFRLGPGGQLTAKMPPRFRPVDDLIHEIDLNPIMALPAGRGCIVVDALIVARASR